MLLLLFFASGFAGLVYEVCWVRGFGNEFGNTVHSASLVTAVFMAGLGLGSFRAGHWADRRIERPGAARALLRTYGAAELAIGAFGIALAVILPRLGGLSAAVSTYARDPRGWHTLTVGSHALRYAIAIALMAPPSVLMGATLTLLVRSLLARDVSEAGLRIGLLYAANTAGAAVGAYATDAWLVPGAGIFATQAIAAGVNLVVAVGAAALAARVQDASPAPAPADTTSSAAPPEDGARVTREATALLTAGCIALAMSGFAALGMEIVWFRFLAATLGAFRSVFALVLTSVLVGIVVGSALGGVLQRRYGRALELFVASQASFAVLALLLMAVFTPPKGSGYVVTLETIAVVVGLPSVLMGCSFPLVNALVQDAVATVGRRAGSMYLANTLGSVLGSLAAGFVLTSWLGSQASFAVLAAVAALAPAPLAAVRLRRSAPPSPALALTRNVTVASLGAAVIGVAAFAALPPDHIVRRFIPILPPPDRILATHEGPEGTIHILDNRPESRVLFTNGHPMSGTSLGAQRYMRAFAHVPLLMKERPERALVICFGVGSTLHATSLHPLERIDLADLSRGVLSHASYFEENNHGVLRDPRVSVFVQDGRQHLRQEPPGTYDLVTLEPPPIEFAGISALYSREFYELARSRLKPDGILTQWLPAYAVPPETGLAMVRAFLDAFPRAVLLSGQGPELILMGTPAESLTLDLDRVEAGLRARPDVAADLARVRLGSLADLAATFVADASWLGKATTGVASVTDDRPSMEYTFGRRSGLSPLLFGGAAAGIRGFCPKCFDGDAPAPRVAALPARLAILERLYATKAFLRNEQPFSLALDERERAVARDSDYLTSLLGGDPRRHFAAAFSLAQRGDLHGAERELRAGLAILPQDAEAHYNLAVVLVSTSRDREAVAEAKKALELTHGEHASARRMLCSLSPSDCPR